MPRCPRAGGANSALALGRRSGSDQGHARYRRGRGGSRSCEHHLPRGSHVRHDRQHTHDIDEAPPRRLVRTDDGRWLGGVCAGLGRYFDVNPLVYRIAFAALALAGGTGLLLYVAAWLVIPAERREESIAVEALRGHRDRPWLLLGVGLLAFGALLALSEARFWPGTGNVWLAATLAGGGARLVARVESRPRPRRRVVRNRDMREETVRRARRASPPRPPGGRRSSRPRSARSSQPPACSASSPCSTSTTSTSTWRSPQVSRSSASPSRSER